MRRTARRWIGGFFALVFCGTMAAAPAARAQPTSPASPSAAQPTLPQPLPSAPSAEGPGRAGRGELLVRKSARHVVGHKRHARRMPVPPLERPTLAGVVLVAPLAVPPEPPHFDVPVPAYPFETLAADFTTPPPPIVCRHVPREPGVPDPRLYRERRVACEPDNP